MDKHISDFIVTLLRQIEKLVREPRGGSKPVQKMIPGVNKGDRIVWVREPTHSNEPGVVRWTGIIKGEEVAGIEFDRALGLGSGWYKDKQLFKCAPHRGGLVAVAGLILEDDYLYNPEISTKDSTGNKISPVRGDSSSNSRSSIGSGSWSGVGVVQQPEFKSK